MTPNTKKIENNNIIPLRTLFLIFISFFIIFLGSFLWISDCFGVSEDPLWFESFEDFPFSGISLYNYAGYTSNPYDSFHFSGGSEGSFYSDIFNSSHGDFSIIYNELDQYSDFDWESGIPIIESTEITGGELFFDYFLSSDLCSTSTLISPTKAPRDVYYYGAGVPHTLFNYGEWNAIEIEWGWDPFSIDQFVFGVWVNGVWDKLYFGEISAGELTGFFLRLNPSTCSDGYILVDNFRMYDSIDVVDPEEQPPEETSYDFTNWNDYYSSVSEKFPTSTPLFVNMANAFSPIISRMGDFTLFATEYFDVGGATLKGTSLGEAIPVARGYLIMIDDFIGLPLASLVLFYFLTMAVVISYKIILAIIKLLKP